ncbi:biotin/lipoyl-binding protein [Pseudanabaena sp. PCC 6802]|uniref:biotin/lipoyl-binding protein n=1 Tax=Pseudanabaena sp. PCC 6802 TaxID=118173 RepID=UPI00034B7CEF|nr:biotin/lipoyl-binding protein [Pseudanabaena sp. PCC 6802]
MSSRLFFKSTNRLSIGLAIAATAMTSGIIFFAASQAGLLGKSPTSADAIVTPTTKKVTALGRLEPQTEVIRLSAPAALDGDRVTEILVKQSDRVKKGQVVAILDSRDRLQAALAEAKERVRVAQSRLAQVKAGAKSGEIQA